MDAAANAAMNSSWFAPVDNYCERLDASFWSEPLNAVTNVAFLFAAAYGYCAWRRAGARDGLVLWLIVVTAAVGIGSFLFHTVAERWAVLADVIPIAVFIYSYFWLAMRRYLHLGRAGAAAVTIPFVAFNLSFEPLWRGVLPGIALNGSVGYLPAAAALFVVGGVCASGEERAAGRALLWAATVFALSLVFRSLDRTLCGAWPTGTHFLWHMLNACVLGILAVAAVNRSPKGMK